MRAMDIEYSVEEEIAWITLDRPARRNALRIPESMDALSEMLADAEQRSDVRVVVISGGSGPAFCSGFDLAEEGAWAESDSAWLHMARNDAKVFLELWDLTKPSISVVNGPAVGAGVSLALVPDITICAETAWFAEPEVRHVALAPMLLLPLLGAGKVAQMFYLTGERLSAQEAKAAGLVNIVAPVGEIEDVARKVAASLLKVPPLGVELAKASLHTAYDIMGFRAIAGSHLMADAFALASVTEEKSRLREAFVTKGVQGFFHARDSLVDGEDRKED